MKFSIIIATLNNEKTLDQNLQSIIFQKYKNYEIIIVDGGSNDDTIKIVQKYNLLNLRIINQLGKGVYNAFNEGISISNGEVIIILNADDSFSNENVLSVINQQFQSDNDLELLMSNINIINKNKKIIRSYNSNYFFNFMFYLGHMPPHPGIFVKKSVYNNFGKFNENFENAGDFEFLLRVLLKEKIKFKKINKYLVSMSHGGKSNKNFRSFLTNTKEIKKALNMNNYFSSYFLILFRFVIKIFQFRI